MLSVQLPTGPATTPRTQYQAVRLATPPETASSSNGRASRTPQGCRGLRADHRNFTFRPARNVGRARLCSRPCSRSSPDFDSTVWTLVSAIKGMFSFARLCCCRLREQSDGLGDWELQMRTQDWTLLFYPPGNI